MRRRWRRFSSVRSLAPPGFKAAGVGLAMVAPLALLTAIGVSDWLVPLTKFPSAVEQE